MRDGRSTIVGYGVWKQLGLAFLVMASGLAVSFVGLGWDFYEHEIAGVSADLESIYAPPHLFIFGGIGLIALGLLLGAVALRREGHTPLGMVTS